MVHQENNEVLLPKAENKWASKKLALEANSGITLCMYMMAMSYREPGLSYLALEDSRGGRRTVVSVSHRLECCLVFLQVLQKIREIRFWQLGSGGWVCS